MHPFEDGNGRIHRYLIHHVLAQAGYNPPGLVFPVSAVILDRREEYRKVLQQYSHKLLPLISWEISGDNNVQVINKTDDFYRFYDATSHAEFLFSCVKQTIERDLPEEVEFLRRYDEFRLGVESIVDMPDKTIHLLFSFLRQNSRNVRERRSLQSCEMMRSRGWKSCIAAQIGQSGAPARAALTVYRKSIFYINIFSQLLLRVVIKSLFDF